MSTFKNVNVEEQMIVQKRYAHADGDILFDDAFYMNSNQSVPIDWDTISNGIVLHWRRWSITTQSMLRYHSNFSYIPRAAKDYLTDADTIVITLFGTPATAAYKLLYLTDSGIVGNDENSQQITNTWFGTVDNRNWVLARVYRA